MTHPPDDPLEHYRVFTPGSDDEDLDDDELPEETRPALEETIATLLRGEYPRSTLVGLNDLSVREARRLATAWPSVPLEARRAVVVELSDLAEERFDYTFHRALEAMLDDTDATVRQTAIAGLWGHDDSRFAERLLAVLASDPSEDVRAAAARGLAYFVELGEWEEIPEELSDRIYDALMAVLESTSEPMHLRAQALETVSACTGKRDEFRTYIEQFYDEDETGYRATALFAMGRSFDKAYLPRILNETTSDDAALRFEAARAAGRIGDKGSLPVLAELATDEDAEVRFAAIAAMGEIGGQAAIRYLTRLLDDAPETDLELIQDAIDEATMLSDPLLLDNDDLF
jgi:HEAT repeat protein